MKMQSLMLQLIALKKRSKKTEAKFFSEKQSEGQPSLPGTNTIRALKTALENVKGMKDITKKRYAVENQSIQPHNEQ